MKLKKANSKFKKNGFDYSLIRREGNIALYEQRMETLQGLILAYEVHLIRVSSVCGILVELVNFKDYSHYEQLPSNEDFGQYGWSYQLLSNAQVKFKEVRFQEWKKEQMGEVTSATEEFDRYEEEQKKKIDTKKEVITEIENGIASLKEISSDQKVEK